MRPIRVPRGLQDAQARVRRTVGELTGSLGRSPSVDDIDTHLEIVADDVLDALAAA